MTTDEMRIAIAEHLGWKPDTRSGYFINESKQEITPEWCLPNFPEDLNAMRDALKTLGSPKLKVAFLDTLRMIVGKRIKQPVSDFDMITSEPQEQAEAFLRCVGKWKE